MRFSSIFFALPLVASAFAAPTSVELPSVRSVKARHQGSCAPAKPAPVTALPVVGGGLDVISIVTELQTSIHAVTLVGSDATEIEAQVCLEAVVSAFDKCGSALGIDISLGLDVEIDVHAFGLVGGELEIVSELLADVVQVVNGLLGELDSELCARPVISALIVKINCAVGAIVTACDHLIKGLFGLVTGILGGVGLDLRSVLGGFLGAVHVGGAGHIGGAVHVGGGVHIGKGGLGIKLGL